MNYGAIQRNGVSSYLDTVVCPKPRRPSFHDPSRNLRWHLRHQDELCDARAGSDLLDIILTKGGGDGSERLSAEVAPFFNGSPPGRVSNPLVHDVRFKEEKKLAIHSISPAGPRASPSSGSRKGGCLRANFGSNPAVRVEGFDCLDRDRRNCSIPTFA